MPSNSVALYGCFLVERDGSGVRLATAARPETVTQRPPAWFDSQDKDGSDTFATCSCGCQNPEILVLRNGWLSSRDAADARSLHLLWTHLSRDQKIDFLHNGWFVARGSYSKQPYKVTWGDAQNIIGPNNRTYCLVMDGDEEVPTPDSMLTQKLLIECDERRFLETAF